MKKVILGLFLIAGAFSFTACSNTVSDVETVSFESDSQVFTIEALSSANLLDTSLISTLSYEPLSDVVTTETTTETDDEDLIVDDQIDEVDKYLEMMDGFLGNNNGLSVQVLESDRAEYENLISYTTVNLLGEEVVYYMYYNETLFTNPDDSTSDETTTEVPTTEVPETTTETTTETPETTTEPTTTEVTSDLAYTVSMDKDCSFYFNDDDDDSVVYLLEGLIVSNGIEYSVEGKSIIDEDGNEIFRLRSFVDRDNYVFVTYKTDIEDNTQKFFFKVVTDGVIVSESKVRVTEEDGNLKVMLNLIENGDEARYLFSIMEEDGVTYYHIKYEINKADNTTEEGNILIQATLDETTGEIIYTFQVLESENKVNNHYQYKFQTEKKHENRSQRDEHSNVPHTNA